MNFNLHILQIIKSILLVTFLFCGAVEAQLNYKEDSLKALSLYIEVDSLFQKNMYKEALRVSEIAISECGKVGMLDEVAHLLNRVGTIYRINGEYGKALSYFYLSLEHYQNLNNVGKIALSYNHIGNLYRVQGNYAGGLEFLFKALSTYQQISDTSGMGTVYNNIGVVYFYQKNYSKALEYYNRSLEIEQKERDELGISVSYINIGEIYQTQKDYTKALDYYLKALVITKKNDERDGIGILYNEIGVIYLNINELYLSKTYLNMALDIFNELNDKYRICQSYIYLGKLALKERDYDKAISNLKIALNYAETTKSIDLIADASKILSETFELLNKQNEAYRYYKNYISARDSLYNEENTKKSVQAEMLYEFEKQIADSNITQAKKDAVAEEEIRRQNLLRNLLLVVLISLVVIISIIYTAYKNKIKANEKLAEQQRQILEKNEELMQQQEEILAQRDEIEQKNRILEESRFIIEAKNERIISSIEYAQTIQQAILPNEEDLKRFFPEHLVFFKPKDIVSGDFYWFSSIGNQLYVAVIDCTGHGVPGSFMSLIGNIILNQVVNEWQTRDPAFILELVHRQVRKALHQDKATEKSHASMDICLLSIDIEKREGIFTGARRPLFIISEGKLEKIPGDPRPVGGFQREERRIYTKHKLNFEKPTWLYLTTDGYVDQMSDTFEKYGIRRFNQMLLDIHKQPMAQQKNQVTLAYETHRGNHEQIDDICILGLKI